MVAPKTGRHVQLRGKTPANAGVSSFAFFVPSIVGTGSEVRCSLRADTNLFLGIADVARVHILLGFEHSIDALGWHDMLVLKGENKRCVVPVMNDHVYLLAEVARTIDDGCLDGMITAGKIFVE